MEELNGSENSKIPGDQADQLNKEAQKYSGDRPQQKDGREQGSPSEKTENGDEGGKAEKGFRVIAEVAEMARASLNDLSQLALLELSRSIRASITLMSLRFALFPVFLIMYITAVFLCGALAFEYTQSLPAAIAIALVAQLVVYISAKFYASRIKSLIGFQHSKDELTKFKGAMNEVFENLQ